MAIEVYQKYSILNTHDFDAIYNIGKTKVLL